jgi:hypothetical protein
VTTTRRTPPTASTIGSERDALSAVLRPATSSSADAATGHSSAIRSARGQGARVGEAGEHQRAHRLLGAEADGAAHARPRVG